MQVQALHNWNVSFDEAVSIQNDLRSLLSFSPLSSVKKVAGADISYNRGDERLFAAVVVINLSDLRVEEVKFAIGKALFPYIPGLLSFRELPILTECFAQLESKPDVVVCDGQGIAHPRGLGLASHLGLLLNIPTIGCAKKPLVGNFLEVGKKRWSSSVWNYEEKIVGKVLRSKENVKPVYISPGHRIDLDSAEEIIKKSTGRYRLPEPTRQAHLLVNRLRKEHS